MSPRARVAALVFPALAAGCAGSRSGSADAQGGPKAPTVHLDWLQKRPWVTPWGADRIPATRKPSWFCVTPVDHPEAASCSPTEADCKAAAGKDACEPHARAACSESLGGCYPTIAICEGARKTAARDRGQGNTRGRTADLGTPCAWQE